MKNTKEELLNELAFLIGLQAKIWKYHPDNPQAVSVEDTYAQLVRDIKEIELSLRLYDAS